MEALATPPVHGVLRPTCVHPEAFAFKVPDNVGFAEAAMVEPLAPGGCVVMIGGQAEPISYDAARR